MRCVSSRVRKAGPNVVLAGARFGQLWSLFSPRHVASERFVRNAPYLLYIERACARSGHGFVFIECIYGARIGRIAGYLSTDTNTTPIGECRVLVWPIDHASKLRAKGGLGISYVYREN